MLKLTGKESRQRVQPAESLQESMAGVVKEQQGACVAGKE